MGWFPAIFDNLESPRAGVWRGVHRSAWLSGRAPTEAVELGKRLEAMEKPKAAERQKELGKTHGTPSGNLPQGSDAGRTRDKVAEAVGMSGRTYEKAKAVVEAAEKPAPALGL